MTSLSFVLSNPIFLTTGATIDAPYIFSLVNMGIFFLGGGNEVLFPLWSISSHIGIQIDSEMVRSIDLIGWNLFFTHSIFKQLFKNISRTKFSQSILIYLLFLAFLRFFKELHLYCNLLQKVKLDKLERVMEKRAEKIIRMACQEFQATKKSF